MVWRKKIIIVRKIIVKIIVMLFLTIMTLMHPWISCPQGCNNVIFWNNHTLSRDLFCQKKSHIDYPPALQSSCQNRQPMWWPLAICGDHPESKLLTQGTEVQCPLIWTSWATGVFHRTQVRSYCFALSLSHSILLLNFVQIVGFVKVLR